MKTLLKFAAGVAVLLGSAKVSAHHQGESVPSVEAAHPTLNLTANLGGPSSITSGFDIVLSYATGTTPTASELAAFAAAEAIWESVIAGYQSNDLANTNLNIEVTLEGIDGVGNILGSAGPQTVKLNAAQNAINPDFIYSQSGAMTFDTADTANLNNNGLLDDVILHEMGHVIGIGLLWSSSELGAAFAGRQELYVTGSGEYTGAAGVAAYNNEFNQTGTFVPVELDGGQGTANAHWEESLPFISNITNQSFDDELMTGFIGGETFLSSLTIASLEDMGYVVVPEPIGWAMLGGILGLIARRRRTVA